MNLFDYILAKKIGGGGGGGTVPLLSISDWLSLTPQEKHKYGLVAVQDSDVGSDRGELYYGEGWCEPITPSSTSGPSGTKGTWTAATGYDGYYLQENIENGYFLLSYNTPFYLYEIHMESSAINKSSWIYIFEYYDVNLDDWVEVYNSGSAISPRNFDLNIQGYPVVNAVRWRTTTKKVSPYNVRFSVFYASGG